MSSKSILFRYQCPSVAVVMCDSNVNAPIDENGGDIIFLEAEMRGIF